MIDYCMNPCMLISYYDEYNNDEFMMIVVPEHPIPREFDTSVFIYWECSHLHLNC